MVRPRKQKARRRKGKIKFTSSARLVEKNDATKVLKPDTTRYPHVQGRPPASVGATFKVKLRRK